MPKSKNILIYSSIEGHASMAEAIDEFLEKKGLNSCIFIDEDPLLLVYKLIYRYKPEFFKYIFKIMNWPLSEKIGSKLLKLAYHKKTHTLIDKYQPNLVISTNYAFNHPTSEYRKKHSLPFINIVTDAWSFFNLELCEAADCNCLFDQEAAKRAREMKPKLPIKVTGWFVRERFEAKYLQQAIRKKLKLENKLTLLFVTGYEGTSTIIKNLTILSHSSKPAQIMVACGKNSILLKRIKFMAAILQKNNPKITIKGIAFTKHLEQYMQAADLVIGKAGPNSVFEAVATLTPFFATTHVHGQEDGNLEIIEHYQLGFVEENPKLANQKLLAIIADPSQLKKFQPHLKKLAKHNRQAKERLWEMMQQLF